MARQPGDELGSLAGAADDGEFATGELHALPER